MIWTVECSIFLSLQYWVALARTELPSAPGFKFRWTARRGIPGVSAQTWRSWTSSTPSICKNQERLNMGPGLISMVTWWNRAHTIYRSWRNITTDSWSTKMQWGCIAWFTCSSAVWIAWASCPLGTRSISMSAMSLSNTLVVNKTNTANRNVQMGSAKFQRGSSCSQTK